VRDHGSGAGRTHDGTGRGDVGGAARRSPRLQNATCTWNMNTRFDVFALQATSHHCTLDFAAPGKKPRTLNPEPRSLIPKS
jgi:hypothetical protein